MAASTKGQTASSEMPNFYRHQDLVGVKILSLRSRRKAVDIETILKQAIPRPWNEYTSIVVCPPETEEANESLILLAVNSYESMRQALQECAEALSLAISALGYCDCVEIPAKPAVKLKLRAAIVHAREALE